MDPNDLKTPPLTGLRSVCYLLFSIELWWPNWRATSGLISKTSSALLIDWFYISVLFGERVAFKMLSRTYSTITASCIDSSSAFSEALLPFGVSYFWLSKCYIWLDVDNISYLSKS